MAAETPENCAVAPEDQARAALYRFIARLLSAPPQTGDLAVAASITGDDSPLGRALSSLAGCAAATTPQMAGEQFQTLFIGLGRGELVPYASYYLTGFLQEKPLARLRADMDRLGIARSPDVAEPEDHIASVLEIMAGLIDGAFGEPLPPSGQKNFFDAHVGNWADHFFSDLAKSPTSEFYRAVGDTGRLFLSVEQEAFLMA